MALADLAATRTIPNHACAVCYVATQLDEDTAEALEGALLNPAAAYTDISRELLALGWKISDQTVSRHAAGQCSAGRRYRP